jgi:hypothetical protein
MPIHFKNLNNGEWKPVEDRFDKKILVVGLGSYYPMVID